MIADKILFQRKRIAAEPDILYFPDVRFHLRIRALADHIREVTFRPIRIDRKRLRYRLRSVDIPVLCNIQRCCFLSGIPVGEHPAEQHGYLILSARNDIFGKQCLLQEDRLCVFAAHFHLNGSGRFIKIIAIQEIECVFPRIHRAIGHILYSV